MSLVSCQLSIAVDAPGRPRRTPGHGVGNIQHPPSNIQHRASNIRFGITLTEVLIAMGILTLGLLGVAALFPVGGFYMQRAEIEDRGSAVARTVMADIVARGMLNPRSWMTIVPPRNDELGNWNTGFPHFQSDGKYSQARINQNTRPRYGTFTRPVAETLAEALQRSNDPLVIAKQFGSAYVVDPLGVATMAVPDVTMGGNYVAYGFPSSAYNVPPTTYYYPASQWNPWRANSHLQFTWPVRRVTFSQATNAGWQMTLAMASHYFRGADDLTTDLPDRDDRPASQNWEIGSVNNQPTPLARSWQGDYSWIVSVVPTTVAARNAIATDPESHSYEVSVVVFHKRALADEPTPDTNEGASYERVVKASILSTGLNGGELLLSNPVPLQSIPKDPFDDLRSGQWIMLCGPHPNSNDRDPLFVLRWYQVIAIDREMNGIAGNPDPETHRVVTVRGPQWPWQPTALTDANALSNNLCVGICRGAVAVHSKTLRLEGPRNSAGGGGVAFAPLPPPQGNPRDLEPK